MMAPRNAAPPRPIKPPVPRECDLSMFKYMPLHIERLRRSKSWSRARHRPELGFYMLNLWMFAWHEVPAGSLVADEVLLADRAQCTPALWKSVRDEVMHGWQLATDGRLYHEGLVKVVREAWSQRAGVLTKNADHAEAMRRSRARKRQARLDALVPPGAPPVITGDHTEITPPSRVLFDDTADAVADAENAKSSALETLAETPLCASRADHVTSRGDHVPSMKEKEEKERETERKAASGAALVSGKASGSGDTVGDLAERRMGLRLSDPAHRWVALYGGRTAKDDNGTSLPVAGTPDNTVFLIEAAGEVCAAAGFDPSFRGDWHTLVSWLEEGHLLAEVIVAAITHVREKRGAAYRVPKSLNYFTEAIREYAAEPDPAQRERRRPRRTG